MPPVFLYHKHAVFAIRVKQNTLCLVAIIVIEYPTDLSTNNDNRLRARVVPMDGYHSPWLHRIHHPMALILQRRMEALCRDHTQ